MSLGTAHRVLIATFVAFSIFFGLREAVAFARAGGTAHVVTAILAFACAAGFVLYLARFDRKP